MFCIDCMSDDSVEEMAWFLGSLTWSTLDYRSMFVYIVGREYE